MEQIRVFISYRRRNGGIAYAYVVNQSLIELGIKTFYDKQDMPESNGAFPDILKRGIDGCDVLLLLLQKDMFDGQREEDYVYKEIVYAKEQNKTIVTLPIEDFAWSEKEVKDVPQDIAFITKIDLITPNFTIDNKQAFVPRFLSKMGKDQNEYYQLINELCSTDGFSRAIVPVQNFRKIPLQQRWNKAKRVSLLAIGCGGLIHQNADYLNKCYKSGMQFRFVSASTKGSHKKEIEQKRQCGFLTGSGAGYLKKQFKTNQKVIETIKSSSAGEGVGEIEYRLTTENLTCTIQMVEFENCEFNYIIVEYLPIEGLGNNQFEMPSAIIRYQDVFYKFYSEQFESIWQKAKKA